MGVLLLLAASTVQGEERRTLDTGLAQALRQQLSSECYGFVEHDPTLIRGYAVNDAFQLLRDGYPWARFEASANLLVEREEALVGGPGLSCAYTAPGGTINLVTRRGDDPLKRVVIEADHHGALNVRAETPWQIGDSLAGRVASRGERSRDAAANEDWTNDLTTNTDVALGANTRLRLDTEWRHGYWTSYVGWPALVDLPESIDRQTTLNQEWARYRFDSLSTLVAVEHASSPSTLWRAGMSRVRYASDWDYLYLEPGAAQGYDLVDYAFRDQPSRFDGWQADVTHRAQTFGIGHTIKAQVAYLSAGTPDADVPGQRVGPWTQGAELPYAAGLPPSAERTLTSSELRVSVLDRMVWGPWFGALGGQFAVFKDDNGGADMQTVRWLPVLSLGRSLYDKLSLIATHSWGAYGRQFASLTSATPSQIQPAAVSRETEVGLRWSGEALRMGVAGFAVSRPYRFERGVVSVWRGEQKHRGIEATAQWQWEKYGTMVAATTQVLDARVEGTGEADLDGKRPPGVPSSRGSLYLEQELGAESPWTASGSAEAVSERATYDDNAVFAPGYVLLSVGIQWEHRFASTRCAVLATVQNLADSFAWQDVGGGVAYPAPPRTFGATVTIEQ